jgi:hypothetical protein
MLDDHTYNLLEQLAQESKSLKRIKNEYQTDHGGCDECEAFWQKMEQDKEEHIRELKQMIATHLE